MDTSDRKDRDRREPSDEEIQRSVPKDRGGKEVRVGLFVLLGVISFVVVLFLLTDPATLRGRDMVVTSMADVGGVRKGDPIQMRGVNIGRVHRFEMTPDGRVQMTMEIEGEWGIPQNSVVRLGESGLFGGRTVLVDPGSSQQAAEEWDTIPGIGERSSVFETVESLGGQADSLLTRLNEVLDEPTTASVRGSIGELEALLSELRTLTVEQREELSTLIASLNRSAQGLEEAAAAGPEVASAAAQADSALTRINRTSATLDQAIVSLESVLARLDSGQGTLGRLSRDDSLYVNLNTAAESLHLLLTDLRENPRRYLTVEIF